MTTFREGIQLLLQQLDAQLSNTSRPSTVRGVHLHASASTNVTVNGVRRVGPDTTPLIEKRGWKRNGNTWRGSFVTTVGTWPGRIERRGDILEVFIRQPPNAITSHPKWQCFHKRPNGWWWVHLHTQPHDQDPSAVIAYMERMLAETLKQH